MRARHHYRTGIAILFGIMLSVVAVAAESDDEKQALIDQYLELSGGEGQYEKLQLVMVGQMQKVYAAGLSQAVRGMGQIPKEKMAEVNQLAKESLVRIQGTLKSRIDKSVRFADLKENILFPLYKEHYTAEELKEVIAFYQSPVGQKMVRLSPQIMQQFMARYKEQFTDVLQKIGREVAEAELGLVRPQIEAAIGQK